MPTADRPGTLTEARLGELFRAHAEGLSGAVRGVLGAGADSPAVLQDAFVKALEALRKGATPRDPVAWAFVVTINLAKDRRRRDRRTAAPVALEEVSEMELRAPEASPSIELETAEALAAARLAIQRLSDPEKEVFLLRASGGLTFEATAEALEIPVGTAKTRMRSALARLRSALAAHRPDAATPAARTTARAEETNPDER